VRTGWVYHSNRLLGFFAKEGLLVDTSAVPGVVQSGTWHFDWRGAPRTPYFPSDLDYRRPAESPENALSILEMPVLVRSLSLPLHFLRYGVRKLRAARSRASDLTDWPSSRYQGVRITNACRPFYEAAEQTLLASAAEESVFLSTYFHTDELLISRYVDNFADNLQNLSRLAERAGRALVPTTLSAAAVLARSAIRGASGAPGDDIRSRRCAAVSARQ
jgi:hypothetical protein